MKKRTAGGPIDGTIGTNLGDIQATLQIRPCAPRVKVAAMHAELLKDLHAESLGVAQVAPQVQYLGLERGVACSTMSVRASVPRQPESGR